MDPQAQPDIQPQAGSPSEPGSSSEPAQEFTPFYNSLPETWREDVAKGMELDDSKQNVLNRYESFPKLMEAFFHQRDKISEGVQQSDAMPGEDATPEQWAEYRAAKGIPESPDKYDLQLSEGLVLDEADSEIMQSVYPVAHKHNLPAPVMSELVDSFLQAREKEQADLQQHHMLQHQECAETLRNQWGNDYQTNINMVRGMLNKAFPSEMVDQVEQLMLPDGSMAFNNPVFVQAFSQLARQLNPAGAVVPNTSNPGQAVDAEIQKIEKTLSDDPDAYYKDTGMQDRYRQLLEAREAMQKRPSAAA